MKAKFLIGEIKMKKIYSLLLVICLVFSLSSCDNGDPQKELVDDAIKELRSAWEDLYDDSIVETDGYFEIKNTRVIEIMKNDFEGFEDVDYIIEFVLYTDYMGSSPYYFSAGLWDSVVVYKNGDMEVTSSNQLLAFARKNYSYDYSNIIKAINDHGDKYNCIEYLK